MVLVEVVLAAGGRGSDAPGGRDASEILGDGLGGIGLQVPTTFRDPKAIYDGVHPGSQWYLAGGGGGLFNPTPKANPDRGAKVVVMVAVEILELVIRQALDLKVEMVSLVLAVVVVEAGSYDDSTKFQGGHGGSGVVLIAYPT